MKLLFIELIIGTIQCLIVVSVTYSDAGTTILVKYILVKSMFLYYLDFMGHCLRLLICCFSLVVIRTIVLAVLNL